MEAIEINKDNKEIIRKYYETLYEIELSDAGIEVTKEIKNEISNEVDRKINRFFSGCTKRTISKYISEDNRILKKYYVRLLSSEERIHRAKVNHKNGLDNLIKFYQNYYELDLRLKAKEQNIKNIDLLINKLNNIISDKITNGILNNSENFKRGLINYIKNFYFENGILTDSVENNMIINYRKTGKIDKEKLINILLPVNIKNTTLLPDDKFNKFANKIVLYKINEYLNSDNKSMIRVYSLAYVYRLLTYPDYFILLKYNMYFDDEHELVLNELVKEASKCLDTFIKENNLSIGLQYNLKNNLTYICENIINEINDVNDVKIIDKKINMHFKKIVDSKINKKSSFDIDIVKNSNVKEEIENEEQILIDELSYLKDQMLEKYEFYVSKEEAKKRIEEEYLKIIHSYIYDILPKNNPKQKNTKAYISIRLNDNIKRYANTTLRKFRKPGYKKVGKEEIWSNIYNNYVNNYLNSVNMALEEQKVFVEYIENECKYFITKGSYKEEFETFLIKAILRYNYENQLEINSIKNYIEKNNNIMTRGIK